MNVMFDSSLEFQQHKQGAVYDADNLAETEHTLPNDEPQIPHSGNRDHRPVTRQGQPIYSDQEDFVKVDEQIVRRVNEELKHSHENFFNAAKLNQTLVKPKKLLDSIDSLEKIASENINSILKEGYLEKKTDSMFFKWKQRYFTLTPQKLYFFEDERKQKVIGCVNIKLIPVKAVRNQCQITLDFEGECQNIILKGQDQQQSGEWHSWLEKVTKYHSKQAKVLLKTISKPLYALSNSISERQFAEQAQTGDVLLFYTKHLGAQLQRVFTNSEFDHVGMVVKFRDHEIMVFESNLTTGVSLFEWNQFMRYFNLYEKVTYRKLVSARKAEIEHNLIKFVKVNLGRKYQLNLSKLLKQESNFDWETVNEDTARGYFCSELLAKAYKSAGLIDLVKSSCRYWPVDFSEKNNLQLRKGAHLGPEQAILLKKHMKKKL